MLSKFSHKNIVRYYGFQLDSNFIYIFLEYVGGGSLADYIKKFGPLKEDLIKKFLLDILEGLEYLHSMKVIHRDIKAANILVNHGVCKLSDFGASKEILIGDGEGKSFKGSPYWMAPEVIKSNGYG